MELKKCTACEKFLSISSFPKDIRVKNGLSARCKECKNKAMREHRKTKKGLLTQIYQDQKRNSKKRKHVPPEYSLQEFIEWSEQQQDFITIFNIWKDNNYISGLNPSVDRYKDELPYTFSNIRFTTWRENNNKVHKQVLSGEHYKVYNPVVQMDKEYKFIKVWVNPKLAFKALKNNKGIYAVINKENRTSGGYKWMYLINYLQKQISEIENINLQTKEVKPSQVKYNEDTCLISIA